MPAMRRLRLGVARLMPAGHRRRSALADPPCRHAPSRRRPVAPCGRCRRGPARLLPRCRRAVGGLSVRQRRNGFHLIRNALPIRRLTARARTVAAVNARRHERLMAVGTANVAASCNQQVVLFVEQLQHPLRRLARLRPDAQRRQLALDLGQAIGGVGSTSGHMSGHTPRCNRPRTALVATRGAIRNRTRNPMVTAHLRIP